MKVILGILPLLMAYSNGICQGLYNKGATFSIAPQTIVTLPDSLLNTGTILNDGDLRISGAWINQGTYDATGTGKINFDSDLPQTINHNNQSFSKLVISGTGQKNFLANITIESELDLQSSVLKSANDAKIILLEGSVVMGGSDGSHVVGPVERHGLGNWIFPIGNGTTYLPVEMSAGTDEGDIATLSLHELSGGETLSGSPDLTELSSKRYWELVLSQGSLTNRKMTLPLSDEDIAADLNLLVVAGSDKATTEYVNLGQSDLMGDLIAGSITSKDPLTLRYYTVAATSGETDIEVFNGVSIIQDGKNDWLKVKNIELYPDNNVSIYNRWGDRVFTMDKYDNSQRNFRGESNVNGSNRLPAGTYFYSIDLGNGSPKATGYLQIK